MNCKEYAIVFRALSDPKRVCILQMLTKEKQCGCKLLETFKITQPTLSHHMRILVECGLVNFEKRGKYTDYSINEAKILEMKTFFSNVGSKRCLCDDDCDCSAKF